MTVPGPEHDAGSVAGPVAGSEGLADVDDLPPAEWLAEAAELHPEIAAHIPAAHRRQVAAFLDTPPPAAAPTRVFSHNDLGIEHVLVEPGRWAVTGVIDWSDAAFTDPAADFGLLHRDLGAGVLDAALGRYRGGVDDGFTGRAVFYARCGVLEDLAYGVRTGRRSYADRAAASMAWLFPPIPAWRALLAWPGFPARRVKGRG